MAVSDQNLVRSSSGCCLRLSGLGQLVLQCPGEGEAGVRHEPTTCLDSDGLAWHGVWHTGDASRLSNGYGVADAQVGDGRIAVVQMYRQVAGGLGDLEEEAVPSLRHRCADHLADTDWLALRSILIQADAVRLACLAGAATNRL